MSPPRDRHLVAEYDNAIRERLAIEPGDHPDGPLIDLRDVAILGRLAPGTPGMARQRTAQGRARVPFPDPDPEEGSRWPDKPLFRAYNILDYFQRTGNWPVGSAARPNLRHPRHVPAPPRAKPEDKITWTVLQDRDPATAAGIQDRKLNDGARRSVEQWQHRLRYAGPERK